jgi:N,N'-diacetyllegionaminate synthase
MVIGRSDKRMSATKPITIVAEAAQGYEGDQTQARLLVRAAARGGADLVKFQLVYADELATPAYRWYDLFRQLEMPAGAWQRVREEAEKLGIGLAFDVFGTRSLREALALGARAIKLHVTDFFNDELADAALAAGVDVHVSLGGISTAELDAYLERHVGATDRIVLLAGFQAEPTAVEDNNLARLGAFRERYPGLRTGWMDHTDGEADEAGWLGVLAVPYGVSVIEKHVTLSRPLELEDGVSAVDAEALKRYTARIRVAERALGHATLDVTQVERDYRGRALKAVVALRDIPAGTTISGEAVALKRAPLDGAREAHRRLSSVVGRRLARDVSPGDVVYEGDVG